MREYKFDINAIDLTFPLVKSSITGVDPGFGQGGGPSF